MASELDVLLEKVADPILRADLKRQIGLLRTKRRFGLVFEEHLPERVQLPEHGVRRGTRVVRRDAADVDPREVVRVSRGKATVRTADGGTETLSSDDLVVVASFGEPIYPGLRRLDSLKSGGDKPAHVVIKGENHHVLEALQFTHAGRIDCIYIDPPYNTGARDWKYNNDYVDKDDAYRHSKWLAFMERRLRLAKHLLNPDAGVLIVTIDEKEYLRLGLLLQQVFPEASVQMVTTTVNPRAGVARPDAFTRVDEYLFYVLIGGAVIETASLSGEETAASVSAPIWFSLMRTGSNSSRQSRPNLFYPVWVTADGSLFAVGDSVNVAASRVDLVAPAEGLVPIWPLRPNGTENTWQLGPSALRQAFEEGTARIGKTSGRFTISYLRTAEKRRIAAGEIEVLGRDEQGSLRLRHREGAVRRTRARTVWASPAHDAGLYGSSLLNALIPGRSFPFPKSLYAVEDSLRFVVGSNTDAVVLDFFAGSGTTAHALMRLNRQDGGRRQSISVTNNEVSEVEARRLRGSGWRPGDPDWEALGIFEQVTRPRIEAAVTGRTHAGDAVLGNYKFVDEFPMSQGLDENVEFLELTYLDPEEVEIAAAFEGIAPLLWLRAGARGEIVENDAPLFAVVDTYGVLFDPDHWRKFLNGLHDGVGTVFIVTDSPSIFAAVAAELPAGVTPVRLYENYLSTFTLNTRRTSPTEADAE
jgi:adenine-specific DNA-methyltransferase